MNTVNRVAALLLGILLAAAGLVTAAETVALAVWDKAWPLPVTRWRDRLAGVQWSDRVVLIASIIVFVVGLLVLLPQLRRTRPARVRTSSPDGAAWVVRRRGLERQAASAARRIRGVDGAKAKARGKERRWRLAVAASAPGGVVDGDDVRHLVDDELRRLGVPDDVPVRVTVTRSRAEHEPG